MTILLGGAVVAGTFLVVLLPRQPWLMTKGRVGLRAIQRYQALPKTPRGFKSLPKGGFEPKMTRREAALIVAIKCLPCIDEVDL